MTATAAGDRVPRVTASLWHTWFGYPDGSVLTNLVAWLIGLVCGLFPLLLRLERKLQRSHRELHAKLDRIHEHLGITVPE